MAAQLTFTHAIFQIATLTTTLLLLWVERFILTLKVI